MGLKWARLILFPYMGLIWARPILYMGAGYRGPALSSYSASQPSPECLVEFFVLAFVTCWLQNLEQVERQTDNADKWC